MIWNDIGIQTVAPPAPSASTGVLDDLSRRFISMGKAVQQVEQNRAAMAKLEALANASAATSETIQPTTASPTGMVNQSVEVKAPNAGNGLAKVAPVVQAASNAKAGKAPVQSAQPYMPIFQEASKQYGVPVPVLLAVTQAETDFNPKSVSQTGVRGLMQVTGPTYRGLGFTGDRADPRNSIMAGAKYLSQLNKQYKGNWEDTFYAYNGGQHGVNGIRQGNWGTWANNPVKQKEITNYAPRVMRYLNAWNQIYGQ